ncbi:MAG TPA: manganese efflux pump [Candidatus Dormibacteraeota bacterium]
MTSLLGLLLVSVSVGISNFAGSIGIGIAGIDARTRLRVGIAFGVFEAGMPLLGLVIGESLAGSIGHLGRYLGAVLLVLTGAWTIWNGRTTESKVEHHQRLDLRTLLLTAIALSLDNLVVGFALGVYHVNLLLAALLMGVVSVGMSLVGLELGSRLGARVEAYAEEVGGGILVLVGIALGVGLLG